MINIQNQYVFSVHNLMSLEISIYLWQGCCSFTRSCPTLCDPMNCSTPGFSVLHYLLEFVQTPGHWVSDAIQPFHPLMPPSPLTSIPPSIRAFSSELTLHIRWPKYWSFSFSISCTNEYSGFIFFSIDWFDFLTVQGTLKSVLHHHSSKASIFWHSAFLHLYMTTVTEWEMTTYSSILASKVPWTEEPGRLESMGSQRIGHDWANMHTHTHLWNHHHDLYPYSLKNCPTPKQSLHTMQVFNIYSFIACELVYTQYIVITWFYEIIYFLMY